MGISASSVRRNDKRKKKGGNIRKEFTAANDDRCPCKIDRDYWIVNRKGRKATRARTLCAKLSSNPRRIRSENKRIVAKPALRVFTPVFPTVCVRWYSFPTTSLLCILSCSLSFPLFYRYWEMNARCFGLNDGRMNRTKRKFQWYSRGWIDWPSFSPISFRSIYFRWIYPSLMLDLVADKTTMK